MKVIPYNPIYIHTIDLLLRSNDQLLIDTPPTYGLIAYEDGIAVGCGFIRCIEGGTGMLDSFCTLKTATPEIRDKAIRMIVNKLLYWAKKDKLKGLIVHTKYKSLVDRLYHLNFHIVNGTLLAIKL